VFTNNPDKVLFNGAKTCTDDLLRCEMRDERRNADNKTVNFALLDVKRKTFYALRERSAFSL
jgi:hypothetical protein